MRRCAFLLLAVLIAAGCHVDRDEEVRKAERLLAALPPYPGSVRVSSSVAGGYEGDLWNHADSYTLGITYQLPAGTTGDDVGRFYAKRLPPGWKRCGMFRWSDGVWNLCFERPGGSLGIDTALTRNSPPTYSIVVSPEPGDG
jgi:hypothetical protein